MEEIFWAVFTSYICTIHSTIDTFLKVMKIFKFGGASANSVERIKALKDIVKLYPNDQMVIIISAMGKTTNGLEKVVDAFFEGRKDDALKLFEIIKQQHLKVAKYLLIKYYNNCYLQLKDFFTEIEWLLHDKPVRNYDYYYDQIVCVGELLSTCIISHFLNQEGINNLWVDVRDLLRTDNNFRDAVIDWEYSTEKIEKVVLKNTNKPPRNFKLVQSNFFSLYEALSNIGTNARYKKLNQNLIYMLVNISCHFINR